MSTTLPSHPCPHGCGRLVADAHMNSRAWRDRDREANAHLRPNFQGGAGGACTPCARRHREDPDPAHVAALESYLVARRARAARAARRGRAPHLATA